MVAPDPRHPRRSQAEFPLIDLSEFGRPPLCAVAAGSMSKQDFSRLEVLLQVQSGRVRVADACALIGLRRR